MAGCSDHPGSEFRGRCDPPRPALSVVLPVFNEAETLPELHRRLTAACRGLTDDYELIFVDDGSRDESFEVLRELHAADAHVRALRFSRNFGHHLALTAGLDAARGEVVATMDSDLQDPPEAIPRLYARLAEGYDMVYAIRVGSQFSAGKRLASRLFRRALARLAGFSVEGGVFRLMTRRLVDEIGRCREVDRVVVGLAHWAGFRSTGVEVEHAPRYRGATSYSLGRQWRLARTVIAGFSTAPLAWPALAGAGLIALAVLAALLLAAVGLARGAAPQAGWFLAALLTFLAGVQLVALGIVAEYLGRVFRQVLGRPLYITAERLERPPHADAPQSNQPPSASRDAPRELERQRRP